MRIALLSLNYHAKKQCSIIKVIIIMVIIVLNSTCKVQNLLKNSEHTKTYKTMNLEKFDGTNAFSNET